MKPTIYLIGGLPRCGKSTLAKYLLKTDQLNYVSLDMIQSLLHGIAPELGIDVDMGHEEKVEQFFPILSMYVKTCFYYNATLVIEGDAISPKHIAILEENFPVRSIFLGDELITGASLSERTGCNDWISEKTNAEKESLARWIGEKSLWLKSECERYGVPYLNLKDIHPTSLESARVLLLDLNK